MWNSLSQMQVCIWWLFWMRNSYKFDTDYISSRCNDFLPKKDLDANNQTNWSNPYQIADKKRPAPVLVLRIASIRTRWRWSQLSQSVWAVIHQSEIMQWTSIVIIGIWTPHCTEPLTLAMFPCPTYLQPWILQAPQFSILKLKLKITQILALINDCWQEVWGVRREMSVSLSLSSSSYQIIDNLRWFIICSLVVLHHNILHVPTRHPPWYPGTSGEELFPGQNRFSQSSHWLRLTCHPKQQLQLSSIIGPLLSHYWTSALCHLTGKIRPNDIIVTLNYNGDVACSAAELQ